VVLRTVPEEESVDVADISRNEITLQVLNGCGIPGLARDVRNALIEKGFDVLSFDNAEKFLYEKTVIVIKKKDYDKFDILYQELPVRKVYKQMNENSIYDFIIIVGKDYKNFFKL